jgi:hypothetical protein
MAPSNFFSSLRPGNKRVVSNPTSAEHSFQFPNAQLHISDSQLPDSFIHPVRPIDDNITHPASPIPQEPPVLPPIPRIASTYGQPVSVQPSSDPALPISQDGSTSRDGYRLSDHPPNSSHSSSHSRETFADAVRDLLRQENAASTGYRSRGQSTGNGPINLESPPSALGANLTQKRPVPPPKPTSMQTAVAMDKPLPIPRQQQVAEFIQAQNQQQSAKQGGKFHLRNPISLLTRRRSGQPPEQPVNEPVFQRGPYIPAMTLPDGYDPRIRGKGVHDFSAPRQRKVVSYGPISPLIPSTGGLSASSLERSDPSNDRLDLQHDTSPRITQEHTPVFKEHFDDELSPSMAALRAEELANKEFLKRVSVQPTLPPPPPPPPPAREPPPVPASNRSSQPSLASRRSIPAPPELATDFLTNKELPGLSPVQEALSPTEPTKTTLHEKASTKSPPKTRSRAPSGADGFIPAGLPAHMSSKASRFSFQIGGTDSAAQEKLLEERHKKKFGERNVGNQNRDSRDDFDDDFDPDAMDDFDGFEEEIPMLGEDGFGDEFGNTLSPSINSFNFSQMGPQDLVSPQSLNEHFAQTPVDANGNPIGFAVSEEASIYHNSTLLQQHGNAPQGLGLYGIHQTGPIKEAIELVPNVAPPKDVAAGGLSSEVVNEDEDDMYFDDGMIDDTGISTDDVPFDEEAFDDPNGPLFERRQVSKLQIASTDSAAIQSTASQRNSQNNDHTSGLAPKPSISEGGHSTAPTLLGPQGFIPPNDVEKLNAYHSALAAAANRAAEDGRFYRKDSIDLSTIGDASSPNASQSDATSSRPSLIPDDGRLSQSTAQFSPLGAGLGYPLEDDYDAYNFDDDIPDDDLALIAEANAEALSIDDDGEYGREFGFYANASRQGEGTLAYGGFFVPKDAIVGRSKSGRNAVREPNLTPITERSEYSTRNSFISVSNQFGPISGGAIPSPGLAQLARMSPYGFVPEDEADMSMDALIRLRKGAFGGSSTSLVSTGSSPRNASPIMFGQPYQPSSLTGRGLNTWSDDEEEDETLQQSHFTRPRGNSNLRNEHLEEDEEGEEAEEGEEDEEEDEEILAAANATSDDEGEDTDEDVHCTPGSNEKTLHATRRAGTIGNVAGVDTPFPDSPTITALSPSALSTTSSIDLQLHPHPQTLQQQFRPTLTVTTSLSPGTASSNPASSTSTASSLTPVSPAVIPASMGVSNNAMYNQNTIPLSLNSAIVGPFSPISPENVLPLQQHAKQQSTQPSQPHPQQRSTDSLHDYGHEYHGAGSFSQAQSQPSYQENTNSLSDHTINTAVHSSFAQQPLSYNQPVSPLSNSAISSSTSTSTSSVNPHFRPSHARKGSASADSVTYVKEQDEQGRDRWVLERRRTASTGEMELVGREIVAGGI